MARGTVKWFNSDKGYGFIDLDDGEPEVFVYYSGIQGHGYRSLEAGQRVEYRLVCGAQGSRATAVRPKGSLEQLPVGRQRPPQPTDHMVGQPAVPTEGSVGPPLVTLPPQRSGRHKPPPRRSS